MEGPLYSWTWAWHKQYLPSVGLPRARDHHSHLARRSDENWKVRERKELLFQITIQLCTLRDPGRWRYFRPRSDGAERLRPFVSVGMRKRHHTSVTLLNNFSILTTFTHIGALQAQSQFLQVNAAKERSGKGRHSVKGANKNNSDRRRTYFDPAGPENDAWWEHGCDLERKSEPSSQAPSLEPDQLISCDRAGT